MLKKLLSGVISFSLIFQQISFAQSFPSVLPQYISSLLTNQQVFRPIQLRSIQFDPYLQNAGLLIDKGDSNIDDIRTIADQTKVLTQYFKIGLRLDNSKFWVNLRPDEPERIIDPYLERTELGRVMIEADLQLKKDVSAFTSPDTPQGREYWNKLYSRVESLYGGQDITIPTMIRPWIVPGEVILRVTSKGVYIYKATLNVMLEQDYIHDPKFSNSSDDKLRSINEYSAQLIRSLIIPKIVKDVNSSRKYAELRQVFYSLILAQWFKKNRPGSYDPAGFMTEINSGDLSGLTAGKPIEKQKYFAEYKESVEKGEYNRQESINTGSMIDVRTYCSGGIEFSVQRSSVLQLNVQEQALIPESLKSEDRFIIMNADSNLNFTQDDPSIKQVLNFQAIKDGGNPDDFIPEAMIFGGGTGTALYQKALRPAMKLHRVITPFDGAIFLEATKQPGSYILKSDVVDSLSSSGILRSDNPDLAAPGDITKVILEQLDVKEPHNRYVQEIMKARFDSAQIDMDVNQKPVKITGLSLDSFENALKVIADEYKKEINNRNHAVASPDFTNFIRDLQRFARIIDRHTVNGRGFELFKDVIDGENNRRPYYHSVKNLIFYALWLDVSEHMQGYSSQIIAAEAIERFVKLVKGGQAQDMLAVASVSGLDLVARDRNGNYLLGQEEITQNLSGVKIKDIFLAKRNDIMAYKRSPDKVIKPVVFKDRKVLVPLNPLVEQELLQMDEENKGRDKKSAVIFGPGSQFTSILVHFLIPGTISALSKLKNTPRILVINPMYDAETMGYSGNGEEYVRSVFQFIQKRVKEELSSNSDVSDIFDFVVVNDPSGNNIVNPNQLNNLEEVKDKAFEDLGRSYQQGDIKRGKERKGIIDIKSKDVEKIVRQYCRREPVALVQGQLLDIVNGNISFSESFMGKVIEVIQEYYGKYWGKISQGMPRGTQVSSDHHATVDGAVRLRLLFPYDSSVVAGDLSDRGHRLRELLRIPDRFVAADHEFFAIGGALGIDYLVAMYLRMAFNYENDDLLSNEFSLQGLPALVDVDDLMISEFGWKPEWFKGKSDSQKAGKIYQYLFSKTYYEYFYNHNMADKDELLSELAQVLLYDQALGNKIFQGMDKFGFPALAQSDVDVLKRIKAQRGLEKHDISKQNKYVAFEDLDAEKKLIGMWKAKIAEVTGQGPLNLLTSQESAVLDQAKNTLFAEVMERDSVLRSIIGHFLKGPLYSLVGVDPHIPKTQELADRGVSIIDPQVKQNILVMHALPPMKKGSEGHVDAFVDLFGNPLPKNKTIKEYYDRLNDEIEQVRSIFINNPGSVSTDDFWSKIPRLFAGYELGQEKKINAQEWFIRMVDSINGPLFSRQQRRIIKEYVDSVIEEEDNPVYQLYADAKKDATNQSDPSLILEKILNGFGIGQDEHSRLIVGHKKFAKNTAKFAFRGKFIIIDPEFAEKGGKVGKLDATENGVAVWIAQDGTVIAAKLLSMNQIFMGKDEFLKQLKKDEVFSSISDINYVVLEDLQRSLIGALDLQDICYYELSLPVSRLSLAPSRMYYGEAGKQRLTLFGSLVLFLKDVGKLSDKPDDTISLADAESALRELMTTEWESFISEISTLIPEQSTIGHLQTIINNHAGLIASASAEGEIKTLIRGRSAGKLLGEYDINDIVAAYSKYNFDGDLLLSKPLVEFMKQISRNYYWAEKPQRFLLPVIKADFGSQNSAQKFEIVRLDGDNAKDLVLPENMHEFLDGKGFVPVEERLDQGSTLRNANYQYGSIGSKDGGDNIVEGNQHSETVGGIDFRNTLGLCISAAAKSDCKRIAEKSRFMSEDISRSSQNILYRIRRAQSVDEIPVDDIKEYLAVCGIKYGSEKMFKQEIEHCLIELFEKEELLGIKSAESVIGLLPFLG